MAKKKSNAERQVSTIKAYQSVFSGPLGLQVLHDMMDAHGMMRNTYNGSVNDMLIKEGERLVVLRILKKLNMNVQELRERIEDYERQMGE